MDDESKMKPSKPMSLGQFVDEVQNLAEAMLEDYEDSTGDDDSKTWDAWIEELNSAHINS